MGPDGRLENARDSAPDRAPQDRGDDADENVQRARQPAEVQPDVEGGHQPHPVLALAPDVEHSAAEREGDRERREDQRGRDQQRLLEVRELGRVRVPGRFEEPDDPRPVEDRLVGRKRVRSRREHHEAADEEGEDSRGQRDQETAGALVEGRRRGEPGISFFGLGDDGHRSPSEQVACTGRETQAVPGRRERS